jgi:voltage-gated sodium channel
LYFCALLILGGIIGMSFINSIFVDAMVADNNDDVMTKLNELQKSIDELKEKSNINH